MKYCGWASEILHQLKTVVNTPIIYRGSTICDAGFRNHPQCVGLFPMAMFGERVEP